MQNLDSLFIIYEQVSKLKKSIAVKLNNVSQNAGILVGTRIVAKARVQMAAGK